MRILSLDFSPLFGDENDTLSTFSSDISVFDYDLVIWNPLISFKHYLPSYFSTFNGLPNLSDIMSAKIQADVKRRHAEFLDFLKMGRKLVIIVAPPQECYVATGEFQTSGTGRNARRTRIVTKFNILDAIPSKNPGLVNAVGNKISVLGEGPIQKHMRKYQSHTQYLATMSSPPGEVLATVANSSRAVASVLQTTDGGVLAMLPTNTFKPGSGESDEFGEENWPVESLQWQDDIVDALKALSGSANASVPAWSENFATDTQLKLREQVAKQEKVIERARAKLAKFQTDSGAAELLNQLYLGTGRVLELRVREVLELLGGIVTEPEINRDDWRVEFDGFLAVVEIKGVVKSAAEKHAAQLEKWVAGAYAATGKPHKGILVINTWRETPLDKRTKVDFPDQMIPYCTSRNHVLLTGLDLFVIAEEIKKDCTKSGFWREQLLNTAGRLVNVPNWQAHITNLQIDSRTI